MTMLTSRHAACSYRLPFEATQTRTSTPTLTLTQPAYAAVSETYPGSSAPRIAATMRAYSRSRSAISELTACTPAAAAGACAT